MYKKVRGVTLLELMMVVVVLSLLVVIAYPNYREFVARAKRNEAKAALLQIAQNQERVYLNANEYTENMTQLGFDVEKDFVTESDSYLIQVFDADASNFTATATYRRDDNEAGKCRIFRIDARGERTSDPEDDCWTRTR